MKRKYIIVGIISISLLTALVLIIINLFASSETPVGLTPFCETYPDALICTETNPSEEEIALDMFESIVERVPNQINEEYCEHYFYQNLEEYCKADFSLIIPADFSQLSDEYTVLYVDSGIYDITTYDTDGEKAYVFRVALNQSSGLYEISGLSYIIAPEVVSLQLTNTNINLFMTALITESDDGLSDYCVTYFSDDALIACQTNVTAVVPNADYIHHYEVDEIDVNTVQYTVSNTQQTETIVYVVTFVEVDGVLKVSDISINNS